MKLLHKISDSRLKSKLRISRGIMRWERISFCEEGKFLSIFDADDCASLRAPIVPTSKKKCMKCISRGCLIGNVVYLLHCFCVFSSFFWVRVSLSRSFVRSVIEFYVFFVVFIFSLWSWCLLIFRFVIAAKLKILQLNSLILYLFFDAVNENKSEEKKKYAWEIF